jgi:hypothetical protein
MSGEEVAARAAAHNPYASSRGPFVTGSLGRPLAKHARARQEDDEDD